MHKFGAGTRIVCPAVPGLIFHNTIHEEGKILKRHSVRVRAQFAPPRNSSHAER